MKIDKKLLEDIKDTLEHIVASDEWETLKEGSSAEDIIQKIDNLVVHNDTGAFDESVVVQQQKRKLETWEVAILRFTETANKEFGEDYDKIPSRELSSSRMGGWLIKDTKDMMIGFVPILGHVNVYDYEPQTSETVKENRYYSALAEENENQSRQWENIEDE